MVTPCNAFGVGGGAPSSVLPLCVSLTQFTNHQRKSPKAVANHKANHKKSQSKSINHKSQSKSTIAQEQITCTKQST
jgi:hypothetical protein